MDSNSVIVDRRDGRVGQIKSEISPSRYVVSWDGEDAEEIKTGRDFVRTTNGSARFLQFTDDARLLEMATSSPVDFFKLVLADQSATGMTAQQLKKAAVGYDVAKDVVDAGWKKVSKSLVDDPDVKATSEAMPRYSLLQTDVPITAKTSIPSIHSPLASEKLLQEPNDEGVAQDTESTDRSSSELAQTEGGHENKPDSTQTDDGPSRTARELLAVLSKDPPGSNDYAEASKEFLLNAHSDTDELLYSALTGSSPSPKLIGRLGSALPELCFAVGEYPEPVVAAALLRSRAKLRQLLGAAIAGSSELTKIKRSPEFKTFTSSEVASRFFAQLVEHVGTRNDKSLLRTVIAFERALFDAGRSDQTPIGVWVEFLECTFDLDRSSTQDVRTRALAVITEKIREPIKMDAPRAQIPRDVLVATARTIQDLPFQKAGGRSAFIQAVAALAPELLSEAVWWEGFDVKAVEVAGDGAIGSTLRLPAVQGLVLEPIVSNLVEETATRGAFAYFLGLPSVVVESAGVEGLAKAFRNATRNDRVLRGFLVEVSQEATIQALKSELEVAESKLEATSRKLSRLTKERDEANEAKGALVARLATAAESQGGLRSQEKRQLQVDSIRALAQAVAMVESDAAKLDPHALIARLHSLLKRQGVEPIGVAGGLAKFDRELHDSPGGVRAVGESVVVVRSGYRWSFKTESLVLLKALVAPSEE